MFNRHWMRVSRIVALVVIPTLITVFFLAHTIENRFTIPEQETSQNENNSRALEFSKHILRDTALGVIVGILSGLIASRQIIKPINELVDGVKQVGKGNLGHQVTLDNPSTEFADLASAINGMSSKLYLAEQQRQRIMADVSHELRTPLTVLEANLRAALDDVLALNEADIANLYSQTHFLIKLVSDLHMLANAEANQLTLTMEAINILEIVTEVFQNFNLMAEEHTVQLIFSHSETIPLITLDKTRIRQVLTNLIDNALSHTPVGGQVKVEIKFQDNILSIAIHDTGDGISSKHIDHIFDRFYRINASRSRSSGGSGLGLAIVKALVEAQGGIITVASTDVYKGTTFLMTFQIAS